MKKLLEPEKIIFLDIDGVLNSGDSCNRAIESGKHEIWRLMPDKKHLRQLSRIVKKTNAKIVISSSWRRGASSSLMWECLFSALGFEHFDILGSTPIINGAIRGVEIQKWIDIRNEDAIQSYAANWNKHPVGKFIILDDDNDMGDLLSHLFRTDGMTGLTANIANKVIKYLLSE